MSELLQARLHEGEVAQGDRHQHLPAGPTAALHDQQAVGLKVDRVGDFVPAARAGHRTLLSFAANPFDHWPLFEAAYREWSQTSDAMISGWRVTGMLSLFRAGFRSGALGMLLVRSEGADRSDIRPGEADPEPWFMNEKHDSIVNQDNVRETGGDGDSGGTHRDLLSLASIGFSVISVNAEEAYTRREELRRVA